MLAIRSVLIAGIFLVAVWAQDPPPPDQPSDECTQFGDDCLKCVKEKYCEFCEANGCVTLDSQCEDGETAISETDYCPTPSEPLDCSQHDNDCFGCLEEEFCGYCPSSDKCISWEDSAASCGHGQSWVYSQDYCPCYAATEKCDCTELLNCGWCGASESCMACDQSGPSFCQQPEKCRHGWETSFCMDPNVKKAVNGLVATLMVILAILGCGVCLIVIFAVTCFVCVVRAIVNGPSKPAHNYVEMGPMGRRSGGAAPPPSRGPMGGSFPSVGPKQPAAFSAPSATLSSGHVVPTSSVY